MVKAAPTQFPASPEVGVTVYTTFCAILEVLVSVWPMLLCGVV